MTKPQDVNDSFVAEVEREVGSRSSDWGDCDPQQVCSAVLRASGLSEYIAGLEQTSENRAQALMLWEATANRYLAQLAAQPASVLSGEREAPKVVEDGRKAPGPRWDEDYDLSQDELRDASERLEKMFKWSPNGMNYLGWDKAEKPAEWNSHVRTEAIWAMALAKRLASLAKPEGVEDMPKMCVYVDIGGGAQVAMPLPELEWQLRYGNYPSARFVAASCVATLSHLVRECSQKEQVRRLGLMKLAQLAQTKEGK